MIEAKGIERDSRGSDRVQHAHHSSPPGVRSSILRLIPEISPYVFSRSHNPLLHTPKAIQRGSNVQGKDGRTVGLGRGGVVVDHVAYFFVCRFAFDYPVMSIKGRFGAMNGW